MAALSEAEEFELLSLEREKAFGSTSGGAATGNPNLRRQGDKQVRALGGMAEPFVEIGGATALGGALGAASAEILGGAGRAMGAVPQLRPAGKALEVMGNTLKAGGRVAPTVAGAISGGASETAGQTAEAFGAGPVAAEGARLAGSLAGAGVVTPGLEFLKKYAVMPSFTMLSKAKKEAVKLLIGQIEKDGPESLTDAQKKFLQAQTGELRGAAKSDDSMEAVGKAMAQSSDNAEFQAGRALVRATDDMAALGPVAPNVVPAEFSDIGGKLRGVIVKRSADMKKANDDLIELNKVARDKVVKGRQDAGDLIENLPEFKRLLQELDLSTGATKAARMQTPLDPIGDEGIRSSLNVVRNAIREKSVQVTENEYKEAVAAGLKAHRGTNPQTGEPAFYRDFPTSFEALDNVRRKLGEVFRGNPPEGYAAIDAGNSRKLYAQISDIQKKYAGEAQERVLDDYARGKEGLEPFISAKGRKATALDRYDDKQFVTDASALPDTYFKTRASVRALKQLTGDEKLVNEAALQYVNKKLEGATAKEADEFMRKNSDWLRDVPMVRAQIENYGAKAIARERGVSQAEAFVKEATSTKDALIGKRYPAERVRNLVMNGNMELWERAGPAIGSSPDGKANVLSAVRQVLADTPISTDKFNRTIRPALKGAALADDAALDLIETKLRNIQEMKIPESEKLGWRKRVILQSIAGYTASGVARGAVEAAKMVPD